MGVLIPVKRAYHGITGPEPNSGIFTAGSLGYYGPVND